MHCKGRLEDKCLPVTIFRECASAARTNRNTKNGPSRTIQIAFNCSDSHGANKNGVTIAADIRSSETCLMIMMTSTMRWLQSPRRRSMCQQRAWVPLAASYALAVEVETGDEPSSSHSQSTCHLRCYPLNSVVVGHAYSTCAHMQVQVVTEDMARNSQ